MKHSKYENIFIYKKFKKVLETIFPVFILIFLLYFQNSILNPGGILALIPIFFYSVFYPELLPFPFILIAFFLIDYFHNMSTIWLFFFLCFYLILDTQKIFDLKKQRLFSWLFFSIIILLLFGLSIIFMGFRYENTQFLLRALWSIILLIGVYIPFANIFNRIAENSDDR